MGDKEAEAKAVSVRARGKGDQGSMPLEGFHRSGCALVEEKSLAL
jgi:threonyl-tRNA synthetase